MLNRLKENYFFAIIRGKTVEDAIAIAKHAILGGIR
ncbi:TPA: 2-dehydro-3-deoxyphosphogluconate aldolase, partial [Streptococcus equi subsp. equi]|nr:2-dehydro-3-deoxyphosphogluconate aldolase [Streptococcus equi subsp. equi]